KFVLTNEIRETPIPVLLEEFSVLEFKTFELAKLFEGLKRVEAEEIDLPRRLDEFKFEVRKTLGKFDSTPRSLRLECHKQILIADENVSILAYNPERDRYTL